jgi:Arc/MetJ-type ribon-helix-helix transcriptional regulator
MSGDVEQYITDKVASGDFESRNELVETAVSMYRDLEVHDALRTEVQRRLENARNGSVGALDIASLKAKLVSEFNETETT